MSDKKDSSAGDGGGAEGGDGGGGDKEERRPLRRRRPISVVPEAPAGESARESRRRLFTASDLEGDDGESGSGRGQGKSQGEGGRPSGSPPLPEGVKRRRRWFSRASREPPPVSAELADTEARAEAARSAAAALRSRLRDQAESDETRGGRPATARGDRPATARGDGGGGDSSARARSSRRSSTPPGTAPASSPARRRRGTTEYLPPASWQRHDLLVVAVALALLVTGALLQRHLSSPRMVPFDQLGLHLSRPDGWLPARHIAPPEAGLAAATAATGTPSRTDQGLPYHVVYQSAVDPMVRIEVRIGERPPTGDLRSGLALGRIARHGEAVWAESPTDRTIGRRDWTRTAYRYAWKGARTDAPRIATAIEYGSLSGPLMYTVTLHGRPATVAELERLVVPTLSVDANHPSPRTNRRGASPPAGQHQP